MTKRIMFDRKIIVRRNSQIVHEILMGATFTLRIYCDKIIAKFQEPGLFRECSLHGQARRIA